MEQKIQHQFRVIVYGLATAVLVAWWAPTQAADPSQPSPTVQEELGKTGDPSEVQERAVPSPSAPATGTGGSLPVVGGTNEPDYKYPWVVRLSSFSCGGVLIDPQWVLTAAHCVTPLIGFGNISYERTDPHTGAVKTETRAPTRNAGPPNNRGVFIHPMYNATGQVNNDIALILLAQPFTINPYIQTVGLPKSPRQQGVVGTLAGFSHTGPLPPGHLAIFRAPIPLVEYAPKIYITANAASASLCPGDSGSGFVTVENGRATVRGIASQATITDCMTPSGEAIFTDVFTFHDWILQTMAKSDASLAGNTRVRWSGSPARGWMTLQCRSTPPFTALEGPLNVVGVEEGAVCEPGQAAASLTRVVCLLEKVQDSGPKGAVMVPPRIVGFTMRTTMANGASEVRSLEGFFYGNVAAFTDATPAGVSREFICQISPPLQRNASILQRGVEGEQPAEQAPGTPTEPEQPSGTK